MVGITIREELTRQPYAGLFILYMIDRFEDLSEDDLVYWDKCCQMTEDATMRIAEAETPEDLKKRKSRRRDDSMEEEEEIKRATDLAKAQEDEEQSKPKYGVYKTELVLLSKSNQSRFSKFILKFCINRKDDRYRQEALKFIECLRHLPEYEALIEEGSEEAVQNGEEEVKFLKKDLTEASTILLGPSRKMVDLIKFSITGNQKQLEKIIEDASFEQDAHSLSLLILSTRGLAVKAYDPSRENMLINTRNWNPIHYAIFFQHFKALKWLCEDLSGVSPYGLNSELKLAIGHTRHSNEFLEDVSFDEYLGLNPADMHLYGLMLAIFAKNIAILKYLYEQTGINYGAGDVLKILKLCLNANWPNGFLNIIKSSVTARLFMYGTLDFKEEFTSFVLVDCAGGKSGLPSQTDEDVIREVKDRMTEYPYSCMSWLYFDPIHKELKNQSNLDQTTFNVEALEILALANQLDRVLKKCDKPRINFDFLVQPGGISGISIPGEPQIQIGGANAQEAGAEAQDDELAQKNREEDIVNQKIHEHKMTYVRKVQELMAQGGPAVQQALKKGSTYSDICENIVTMVIQKPLSELSGQKRFETFDEQLNLARQEGEDETRHAEKKALMLRFVSGYYDFRSWRNFQLQRPLDQLEMEKINLFQWLIFYNDYTTLEYLLIKTPAGKNIQLIQTLAGDMQPLEYVLTAASTGDDLHTFHVEKVGLLIALCRKSHDCLKLLLVPKAEHRFSSNILSLQEILDLGLVLANEPVELWGSIVAYSKINQADSSSNTLESRIIQMIESAFVAASVRLRLEFLRLSIKCTKSGGQSFIESLFKQAPYVRFFTTWLASPEAKKDDTLDLTIEVRWLAEKLKSMGINVVATKDSMTESEVSRLTYLARLKPKKIESAQAEGMGGQQQDQEIDMGASTINVNDILLKSNGRNLLGVGISNNQLHVGNNSSMLQSSRDKLKSSQQYDPNGPPRVDLEHQIPHEEEHKEKPLQFQQQQEGQQQPPQQQNPQDKPVPMYVSMPARSFVGSIVGYCVGEFIKKFTKKLTVWFGAGFVFLGVLSYNDWITINWKKIPN